MRSDSRAGDSGLGGRVPRTAPGTLAQRFPKRTFRSCGVLSFSGGVATGRYRSGNELRRVRGRHTANGHML